MKWRLKMHSQVIGLPEDEDNVEEMPENDADDDEFADSDVNADDDEAIEYEDEEEDDEATAGERGNNDGDGEDNDFSGEDE